MISSNTYKQDLEKAITSIPNLKSLENKSLFITGCNGLICSALVDLLIICNKKLDLNLQLYLGTRNKKKTTCLFDVRNNTFIKLVDYDATKTFEFDEKVDFIIHGAGNASPDLYVKYPVDTMMSNLYGVQQLLNIVVKQKARLLFLSSSEIYGKLAHTKPIKEDAIGTIELLNPRSSYGMSKRAGETLCSCYKQQYGVDYVIVRPGHIFGPTATENDKRVSSVFMYKANKGEDLVLESKGEQLRSYCYCVDCASALVTVLLNGNSGEAYNISNPNSIISIAQMAQLFANYSGVELKFKLPNNEEKVAFNPMLNSSLDSEKLVTLGWTPSFNEKEGFEHTMKILRELDCLMDN